MSQHQWEQNTWKRLSGIWNRSCAFQLQILYFPVKTEDNIGNTKIKATRKSAYLLSICITVQFSNMMTFFHTGVILTIKKPPTKSFT